MKNSEEFNEYVEKFKKLPSKEKKQITIDEMKTVLALLEKLKKDVNINTGIMFNREILDLNHPDATEDDYAEAIFVYINSIKESLSEYLEKILNMKEDNYES